MRHPISKIVALALVTPLAGGMLLAAPASAAPAQAPTAAVKTAAEPYSTFKVSISAPKKAKAGGKITYRIKGVNTGPHDADYFFTGGLLPKGATMGKFSGPKDIECVSEQNQFLCWTPYILEVGESETIVVTAKLSKKSGQTATATLGVLSYDKPSGAEDLSRDELERMGIKSWYFAKKVKTRIVR